MRLGIYCDMAYRSDDRGVSCNRAFVRFVAALPPRVDEVVVFGRVHPQPGRGPYALPAEGVRFVPLPWYARVTAIGALLRSLRRTAATFGAELGQLDAVLVFGPHPMALALALVALHRRTPLVLGVRQDYPRYIRNRLPGRAWSWAPAAAGVLDLAFRMLARRAPTVVLGDELARRYAGGAPVLRTGFSLVGRADVEPLERALAKDWSGELRVLSVGRLDPEKNPLLLLDVVERLRSEDPRWRLTVAGDGPLRAALAAAIAERRLGDAVELPGEVPNGPRLWRLYRGSHSFLHVSLTEGLPQVLFEAQAAGLPIVATEVGGVPAALGHGRRGLLVPPQDAPAAAAALARLASEPALRRRLVTAALSWAKDETLERQLDRLSGFVAQAAGAAYGAPARSVRGLRASAPAAPASATSNQK
jgi:glycosyltransferase involved in cell wall biosynthesis